MITICLSNVIISSNVVVNPYNVVNLGDKRVKFGEQCSLMAQT